MSLSRRVAGVPPSSTLAVTALASKLKATGRDVVSFAAGEPDFPTPMVICDAATKALAQGQTHYAPVPGDLPTRQAIADKLTRENRLPDVTPDHVVITAGGKQALFHIFHALLDHPEPGHPAQEVLLPVPAWVSYAPQAELAGGRVVELPTTAAMGYRLSAKQLDDAITPNSRILVLNSPSNPCSTMYSPDELRELAKVIARAAATRAPNLVVVTDEIYEKLVYPELAHAGEVVEHFSIGSVPEIAERTITVNGLSKAYAMTGWRVGYLAGSGDFGLKVAKACATLQGQSTTSIPTFIMPAIRTALTECEAEVERMRKAFASRARLMHDRVMAIPGIPCPRPVGALYLFIDIAAHLGKTSPRGTRITSPAAFASALLDEHLVAIVPGEDFGGAGLHGCRLTFACSDEQIIKGVERIGAFATSLK